MAQDELTSLDNIKYDASSRAEAVLDHILKGDEVEAAAPVEQKMDVSEALAASPVLEQDSGRDRARVLFVTTDEGVLVQNSAEQLDYLQLAQFFAEIHVICLVPRLGKEETLRVGNNVWVYPVRAKYWWRLPWVAKQRSSEDLSWGGAFRPDIIVGVDPFEAGLAAHLIAKKFDRPYQLHLSTDPFTPDYKKAASDNNWRVRMASYVLKRAKSVKTTTSAIKQSVMGTVRHGEVAVLPHFYNFTGLHSAVPSFYLKQLYPAFSFIALAFGPLSATSHLHDVFSAVHRLLRNSRIGLIIIGDGPGQALFTNKVKLLGIESSVVFLRTPDDLASFLKTADVLVELGQDEESEVRVLQAASAGLPIVATETPLRVDLFKDGESALLCPPGDLVVVTQKLGRLINTTALRGQLAETASFVAESRLHEDPNGHYQALATTIESALTS